MVIGGGPAALGLMCNAVRTGRLKSLVTAGKGLAILEKGLSFGGGDLQHLGINSNTSARGFTHATATPEKYDDVYKDLHLVAPIYKFIG